MSKMTITFTRKAILILLLNLSLTGCHMTPFKNKVVVQGYDCSKFNRTFFLKPIKETYVEFENYEVNKKYVTYICGNQYIHPPRIQLASLFAKDGGKVVGLLKERLIEASDDFTIRDIVLVFAEMSKQKTYDVAGDGDLMKILRGKVNSMEDSFWQQLANQDLNEIQRGKTAK